MLQFEGSRHRWPFEDELLVVGGCCYAVSAFPSADGHLSPMSIQSVESSVESPKASRVVKRSIVIAGHKTSISFADRQGTPARQPILCHSLVRSRLRSEAEHQRAEVEHDTHFRDDEREEMQSEARLLRESIRKCWAELDKPEGPSYLGQ
jgi:hypothetical protein